MKPIPLRCTLGALVACAFGTGPADTLTVYRLGGEKLPVPGKASQEGIDFVRLSWADVEENLSGSHRHIEINESLTPVRLDPTVNMATRILERRGPSWTATMQPHERTRAPVSLAVFDLAGARVADIAVDAGTSGRFSATWDGRDEQARLLSPGLYLLRLEVEADEEPDAEVAALALVY